jgi:hypothetical protein
MKARQPRVPVRWGFVLMSGIVVLGIIGGAIYYGSGSVASNPQARQSVIGFVKRIVVPHDKQ